jgi:hypothetical protein
VHITLFKVLFHNTKVEQEAPWFGGVITSKPTKQGVCQAAALPLTLKSILRKLEYFTMQKYNLQKNPLKETKILQDIITLYLISSFNTSQNIIFQKSSYKNRPIIT